MKPEFLAILACPRCDSRPTLIQENQELVCPNCHYRYPIIDHIPHLIPDEALPPKEEHS